MNLVEQRFWLLIQYSWLIKMGLIETVDIMGLFEHVSDVEYASSMRDGYED